MEHDSDFENEQLERVMETLAEEPEAFDKFLERRVECISPNLLEEIAVAVDGQDLSQSAPTVEDSSENQSPSTETEETKLPNGSMYVPGAESEKRTELILHDHPIVGSYITESSKGYSVDQEWQKVFIETKQIAVQDLTAEQIIERFHQLERSVFLIRAQEQGLRLALEDVLATKNWRERELLLDLDRKERARQNKKKVKEIPGAKSSSAKPSGKGKTKSMKTIDTLAGLGMDREGVETKLKALNLLDGDAKAYLSKKFI